MALALYVHIQSTPILDVCFLSKSYQIWTSIPIQRLCEAGSVDLMDDCGDMQAACWIEQFFKREVLRPVERERFFCTLPAKINPVTLP